MRLRGVACELGPVSWDEVSWSLGAGCLRAKPSSGELCKIGSEKMSISRMLKVAANNKGKEVVEAVIKWYSCIDRVYGTNVQQRKKLQRANGKPSDATTPPKHRDIPSMHGHYESSR
jgi:hypothetical protein